jgi:predicted nuclease of restriction endonuclease-like (RecB) superfamily
VGRIPWGHNRLILDKIKNVTEALFYVQSTIEYGWSRNVLAHQIDTRLYAREGKALTNFSRTLPAAQSELAQQTLKDSMSSIFFPLEKRLMKGNRKPPDSAI